MSSLFKELERKEVLTAEAVVNIRNYIEAKYPGMSPRGRARVFADAVNRVVDVNIPDIGEENQRKLKDNLFREALSLPVFKVDGAHIFAAAIGVRATDSGFFSGLARWLGDSLGYELDVDSVAKLVLCVYNALDEAPGRSIAEAMGIAEEVYVGIEPQTAAADLTADVAVDVAANVTADLTADLTADVAANVEANVAELTVDSGHVSEGQIYEAPVATESTGTILPDTYQTSETEERPETSAFPALPEEAAEQSDEIHSSGSKRLVYLSTHIKEPVQSGLIHERPEETGEPAAFIELQEPAVRMEPNEPVVHSEPNEPAIHTESNEPVVHTEPNEPAIHTESSEPVIRTEPNEPAVRTGPDETVVHAELPDETSSVLQLISILDNPPQRRKGLNLKAHLGKVLFAAGFSGLILSSLFSFNIFTGRVEASGGTFIPSIFESRTGTNPPDTVVTVRVEEEIPGDNKKTEVSEPLWSGKKRMKATAYDLSLQSCGKSPGDPGYGITASGNKATSGRTVAVDPSVIPLGTLLYITFPEEYSGMNGVYVAEDTGNLIKGEHIDIFIGEDKPGKKEVYQKAMDFGVRYVEVEILGE